MRGPNDLKGAKEIAKKNIHPAVLGKIAGWETTNTGQTLEHSENSHGVATYRGFSASGA